jgi:hypothetical protein
MRLSATHRTAGRLEWALDGKCESQFIDMHARLQLAHPVTAPVTGVITQPERFTATVPLGYRQEPLRARVRASVDVLHIQHGDSLESGEVPIEPSPTAAASA